MHESRVVTDIVAEIERVATLNSVDHVEVVRIEIGALSHVTPTSFSGHFDLVAEGTVAQGARLDIAEPKDQAAPDARDVRLVSIVTGSG